MMALLGLYQHFKHAGKKSHALIPLFWVLALIGICLAIFASLDFKQKTFVIITFIVLFVIVLIIIIIAYVFFMLKNPDYLRSESFTLSKIALEKGILGDNENVVEYNEEDVINVSSIGSSKKNIGNGK